MTTSKFYIIGRDGCPWCDKAKALAEKQGLSFEYIDITGNEQAKQILRLHGHKTVPQVFQDTEFVGGYDAFKTFLDIRGISST